MDPGLGINPADLTELLSVVGGVLGSGMLGFFLVRRARASRRRQIEEANEPPARELPRRRTSARELDREPETEDEGDEPHTPPSPLPMAAARTMPDSRPRSAPSPVVAAPAAAPAVEP